MIILVFKKNFYSQYAYLFNECEFPIYNLKEFDIILSYYKYLW